MSRKTLYLYLHGFTSSPNSKKAVFLTNNFKKIGIDLITPDFNRPDFRTLTLSRQIAQVSEIIKDNQGQDIIILGSSFGGLTAAILAELFPNVIKLILLAPAFQIEYIFDQLTPIDKMPEWKQKGHGELFHFAYQRNEILDYIFYEDFKNHSTKDFSRQIPTLIFHGNNDKTIPISFSQSYTKNNKLANLIELDDDHDLTRYMSLIWDKITQFITDND
jgi:pimeloyl-ACP methyl ester carboxylesterase